MKCRKCGNNLFFIRDIPCCDDCDQNLAWDDEIGMYVSDLKIIDEKQLSRCQVYDEGE